MDRRTLEGIEACRPGSNDIAEPALAAVARAIARDPGAARVYEETQRRDALVAKIMHEVPVPDGLSDRVLARLGLELPAAGDVERCDRSPDSFPNSDGHRTTNERTGRTTFKTWQRRSARGAVAAAAVLIAALLIGRYVRDSDDASLEAMADRWLAEAADGQAWQTMDSAPEWLRIPGAIVAAPASWRRLGDRRTIACRLVNPAAGTALLFVARISARLLPDQPPAVPQSTTGGQAVASWQSDSHVYVLVVPGNVQSYRTFVRTAPSAVAASDRQHSPGERVAIRQAG